MRLLHFTCSLLLGLLISIPLQAAEETPWYEIELILFKQGPDSGNSEQWPDDPGSPDWEGMVSLVPEVTDSTGQPPPYAVLPSSAWQLRALYNELGRSNGVEPLFHQTWRQPVVSSATAAHPVYLGPHFNRAVDTSPTPPFEGTIRISVNRYFHVNLDLLLMGANRAATATEPPPLANSPTWGSIRFIASRRMRSGELHYIDHPRVGALILISRVEPPPPAEPEPAAGNAADMVDRTKDVVPADDTPAAAPVSTDNSRTTSPAPQQPGQ